MNRVPYFGLFSSDLRKYFFKTYLHKYDIFFLKIALFGKIDAWPTRYSLINYCIKREYLQLASWCYEKSCPMDHFTWDCAAAKSLDAVKWLYSLPNAPKVDTKRLQQAASSAGNISVLKWLMYDLRKTIDADYITIPAASHGQLHLLQWFATIILPKYWSQCRTCFATIRPNHLIVLQWLIEQGCKYEKDKCLKYTKNPEMINYLFNK